MQGRAPLIDSSAIATRISRSTKMHILSRRDTFTASIFRLQGSGGRNFILKVLKDDPSSAIEQAFNWELTFYQNVYPSLPAGLTAELIGQSDPDAGERPYLILRDLTASHAALDWPSPPTVTQARQAITSLARLHASSAKCLIPLGGHALLATRHGGQRNDPALIDQFTTYLRGRVEDRHRRAIREISELAAVCPETEPCLLQGDSHFWNALYPPGGEPAVLIDWQDWRIGSPSYDLGYMLSLQLCPVTRGLDFREVLFQTYLSAWLEFDGRPLEEQTLWTNTLVWGLQRAVQTIAWQWSIGLNPAIWTRTLTILCQLPEYQQIARRAEQD